MGLGSLDDDEQTMGSDDDCGLRGSGGYHLMEVIKRFLSEAIFK